MAKYFAILAVLLVVIMSGLVSYRRFQGKDSSTEKLTSIPKTNNMIFEKTEESEPCLSSGKPCSQSTKLYDSGRLVFRGNRNDERSLNKDVVDQIIGQIRQSGIMEKSCEASSVLDYYATYKISLDGQEKTIRFPGCENELKRIESIFLEN